MTAYGYIFEPLHDDPRYVAIADKALANINNERLSLGLAAIDVIDPSWQ